MFRLFAPIALFLSLSAHAAVPAVDTVGGASNYTTTGTVTIYGGLAGDCTGTDTSLVCNSCTTAGVATCGANAPFCPCNSARIWDGLIVRINLKAVANNTYNAVAQLASGNNTNTNFPAVTPLNGGSYINFRWTDICNAAGSTNGCTAAGLPSGGTVTVRIALDKDSSGTVSTGDEPVEVTFKLLSPTAAYEVMGQTGNSNEGIDGFVPYPGDEKIKLEDPHGSSTFPLLNYSTKATAIRVYFSDTSLANAQPGDPEYAPVDLRLNTAGDLDNSVVDGLTNDTLYYFRIALLDEANNVVQYFPDQNNVDASCLLTPTDPGVTQCPYVATPSQVLGLLTKDFNCFIATAAYGSTLEPKLNILREFRHKFLLRNPYGLKFVQWYYEYGPYAARYIHDKPLLRAMTRGLLWPVYGFSYLAIKVGFAAAFAMSLVLLTSLITLPWLGVRRIQRRE